MTTITSPRSSNAHYKSPPSSATPSTRSSLSVDRPQPHPGSVNARRNRSALRDYYNLPDTSVTTSNTTNALAAHSANDSAPPTPHTPHVESPSNPYDHADFNEHQYVNHLLHNESLAKILKTESELLSEIRGYDGERKALVYDNYSKLIDATATIGRVREMLEVEKLTGEKTSNESMAAAVGKVGAAGKGDGAQNEAPTAGGLEALVGKVVEIAGRGATDAASGNDEEAMKKTRQKETVKWALDTPRRMEEMVKEGKRDEAVQVWEDVRLLLDKWSNVKGTRDLRGRCERALEAG
ncbi:MAG: hypothetical protein Q9162_001833 [Coniocarpon cinnabarinum]